MGCDVHPLIEYRDFDNWWSPAAIPNRERNYEFFSLLAGVRGEYEPWVEPRGFPENSYSYNYGKDGIVNGDHTPSWFTLEEAENFVCPADAWEATKVQWSHWLETMRFFAQLYHKKTSEIRVVFNFDS